MKSLAILMLVMAMVFPAIAQQTGRHSKAYTSAAAQIARVENGRNQTVTFTADELSAFVNEGGVILPAGVSDVKFAGKSGTITGTTKVDFDKITSGKSSMNPLMMLFSGMHDVTVTADGQGSGGRATVNVQTVEIDGVTVPHAALEYFVNKYVQPKYGPNVGLNSTFQMPAHVDSAVVGDNTLTITQK